MRLAAVAASLLFLLPPGQARAMTTDEIVAKAIEARGGLAKLTAVKSVRLTGKFQISFGDNNIEAAWASLQKRPGKIRTELSLQGLTQVQVYDGHEGWNLDPFQGKRDATKVSADDSKSDAQDADFEGPSSTGRKRATGSNTSGPRTWTGRKPTRSA